MPAEKKTILLILFIFGLCQIPAGAVAQPDTPRIPEVAADTTGHYALEEIVVTGTRYQKKIIDIPYPVRRLVSRDFQYNKPVAVDNILADVPGLFMESRYGNHDVRISIRGFGSRSNSGIRGVRILLDEIPESEPDGQTRIEAVDFNSIGRIEVVKGNSSSLYPNAPGGVIHFLNDLFFPASFITQFSNLGSFGLKRWGVKTGVRTPQYTFLATYSHHRYDGYRAHSNDHWHNVNTVLETTPTSGTSLQILGYFVDGEIRLPGSLNRQQYLSDPWQAGQREVEDDFRRLTRKGRLGLRFSAFLDEKRNTDLQITLYGTIKYFERATREYRVINRDGLGCSVRLVNRGRWLGRESEFSAGGDLLHQTGPVEYYRNDSGQRSDTLLALNNETIANQGFYFQSAIDLYARRCYIMLTGRFDRVMFDQKNRLVTAQSDRREFQAFTPKLALNYKLTPTIALYSSAGLSFESPAGNELDNYPTSSEPEKLMNPDLEPQQSLNFELGVKGNLVNAPRKFFAKNSFEISFFHYRITEEIVPFEVFGDYYFRNSARTNRSGLEMGVEAQPYSPLTLKLSYTYSDFYYKSYTTQSLDDTDGSRTQVHREQDFSGNQVPSFPRHHFYLSLSGNQPLTGYFTGFVQVSYRGVGGMPVNDANSEWTDAYQVVDCTVGGEFNAGRFSLLISGGILNLLDERYVGFINTNSASGSYYEAAAPRNGYAAARIGLTF